MKAIRVKSMFLVIALAAGTALAGGLAAATNGAETPAARAPAEGTSTTASGPVDIMSYSCWQLATEAAEDQTAAVMFFYGYLAAQNKLTSINGERIAGNVKAVRMTCDENPDMSVVEAFRLAILHEK